MPNSRLAPVVSLAGASGASGGSERPAPARRSPPRYRRRARPQRRPAQRWPESTGTRGRRPALRNALSADARSFVPRSNAPATPPNFPPPKPAPRRPRVPVRLCLTGRTLTKAVPPARADADPRSGWAFAALRGRRPPGSVALLRSRRYRSCRCKRPARPARMNRATQRSVAGGRVAARRRRRWRAASGTRCRASSASPRDSCGRSRATSAAFPFLSSDSASARIR